MSMRCKNQNLDKAQAGNFVTAVPRQLSHKYPVTLSLRIRADRVGATNKPFSQGREKVNRTSRTKATSMARSHDTKLIHLVNSFPLDRLVSLSP